MSIGLTALLSQPGCPSRETLLQTIEKSMHSTERRGGAIALPQVLEDAYYRTCTQYNITAHPYRYRFLSSPSKEERIEGSGPVAEDWRPD